MTGGSNERPFRTFYVDFPLPRWTCCVRNEYQFKCDGFHIIIPSHSPVWLRDKRYFAGTCARHSLPPILRGTNSVVCAISKRCFSQGADRGTETTTSIPPHKRETNSARHNPVLLEERLGRRKENVSKIDQVARIAVKQTLTVEQIRVGVHVETCTSNHVYTCKSGVRWSGYALASMGTLFGDAVTLTVSTTVLPANRSSRRGSELWDPVVYVHSCPRQIWGRGRARVVSLGLSLRYTLVKDMS